MRLIHVRRMQLVQLVREDIGLASVHDQGQSRLAAGLVARANRLCSIYELWSGRKVSCSSVLQPGRTASSKTLDCYATTAGRWLFYICLHVR